MNAVGFVPISMFCLKVEVEKWFNIFQIFTYIANVYIFEIKEFASDVSRGGVILNSIAMSFYESFNADNFNNAKSENSSLLHAHVCDVPRASRIFKSTWTLKQYMHIHEKKPFVVVSVFCFQWTKKKTLRIYFKQEVHGPHRSPE